MHFLLLLFLMAACMPDQWGPSPWVESAERSAVLTGMAMAMAVGLAAGISWRFAHLMRTDPDERDYHLRRYSAWRFLHVLVLFGMYLSALYVLGWGWAIENIWDFQEALPDGGTRPILPPGGELLVLAPFLAALVASWACFYEADRAVHDVLVDPLTAEPYWGRLAYLGFHVRQYLALVLLPVLLLVAMKALSRAVPDAGAFLGGGVAAAGALTVFATMPWLLRLVLRLKPLPEGPLRTRLLTTAKRLRFRCNDILVWHTRGGVANAMVAGVLPWLRYVLFTDRLLSDMTTEEVEAVFGHEVGHVKHHHMTYYLGFMTVSIAVLLTTHSVAMNELAILVPGLEEFFSQSPWQQLSLVMPVALVGAYIFVVFGFVSRRCERQADIHGCRAVSCGVAACRGHDPVMLGPAGGLCNTGIDTFVGALEKVARLNGISRDRPGWLQSWQHSTIARRVEFLQSLRTDPALEPRFQRRVALVKWALLAGLAGLFVILGMTVGWERLLEQPL